MPTTRLTRRSLALGAAALTAPLLPRLGHAQSTPVASPSTGTSSGMLVDPAWLAGHQDEATLVAFMSDKEAAPGVIDGSNRLDWPDLEVSDTTPDGLAAWTRQLTEVLPTVGILPMKTTVAYDAGSLFAARLWWVLAATGHRDVHVLDGGLPAWSAAGHKATAAPGSGYDATGEGELELDLAMIAPIADVEAAVGAPDVTFIDARAPKEYAAGHIPGAINVNYPRNAQPDAPHTWLPAAELETLYADVPREHTVIPYCSSGVRSAVTAFTLRLIGYGDVRLFTGSWNEWSKDPNRPVTTGDAP
jgi:thiosulfate/3-mercaptopyruvate sulfurtransferase